MMKRVIIGMCTGLWLVSMDVTLAAHEKPASITVKHVENSVASAPAAVVARIGYPVRFSDTDIFVVTTSPISSLTPENRAKYIQQNIQNFADSMADVKLLKLITLPEGIAVHYEDQILVVISDRDAANSGKTADDLTREILGRIQSAVENYRTSHSWKTYGTGAMFSILAIVGLWQALYWNNRAYKWLRIKVSGMDGILKREIRFKTIRVLSARQIEISMLVGLRLVRIFVALLCLYFLMPLILSFFPETHKLGSTIFDYMITPFSTIFHALVKYIPNLFFIAVIGVIAFYALKVISYVFELIEHGELKFDWFYDDWARPTYQIVRFLVIVTALISAYPYIPGSSSQAFQGVGLVLGAIISFASSSAISNIVAGVILTYTRAFRLGDRIKVGETTGDVVVKTLLVTRVETIKSEIVTIPNSLVMGAQIINFSTSADGGDGVILHTTVTIGYDVPWKQVRDLLVEAARETKNILDKPEPFVLQTALDDFYVSYEINAYTKEPKYMAFTYSELHKNILEKFNTAGVEIMSPHYYALRDGNAATVPSILSDNGYTQPAFKISNGLEMPISNK